MRNIHILSTDKPSRLILDKEDNTYLPLQDEPVFMEHQDLVENQHIYITNDERIELGDWFYDDDGELFKVTSTYVIDPNTWKDNKKIVLTTDQDLIDDGVQAITNTFAEWFVANPGCKEDEVIEFTMKMISQYVFGNTNIWDRDRLKESLLLKKL